MTQEEIIRMVLSVVPEEDREEAHNGDILMLTLSEVERFSKLVAEAERANWPAEMEAMERQVNILTDELAKAIAKEREACAKVCESLSLEWEDQPDIAQAELATMLDCALAIRARGEA